MRVALVAPMVTPIRDDGPPVGGAQALLADLARGLSEGGDEVTLLAASGSRVAGARAVDLGVRSEDLAPARFEPGAERTDVAAQADAFGHVRAWLEEHAAEIDVVHAHAFDAPAFDLLDLPDGPRVVHTVHLPPVDDAVVAAVRRAIGRATLVAVSRHSAERWIAAGVAVEHVIPNGIAVERIPFGERSEGYLLFAGRLSPEKGADSAIRVARRVGRPLVLVGDAYDQEYVDHAIRPLVGDAVAGEPVVPREGAVWLGPRPRETVFRLMAGAVATLMPAGWDEPFGLVAVESQAAGTPVAGYRRGALAEVVRDGETGVLVEPGDERALVEAVQRAMELDRRVCRGWVEERFRLDRMVADYRRLYATVVSRRSPHRLDPRLPLARVERPYALGTAMNETAPSPAAAAPEAEKSGPAQIDIDEFARMDLRVGEILTAERVPKADRLLHFTVDVGEEQPRQIVAGLAQYYEPETLVGHKVLIVANLKPRTLRGLVSQGMVLAASVGEEGRPVLATVPKDVPNGSKLR